MTVIATGELEYFVSTGGCAGETNGAHHRFGALIDESDLGNRRNAIDNFAGQLDFERAWRTKANAVGNGILHRCDNGLMPDTLTTSLSAQAPLVTPWTKPDSMTAQAV